MKQVQNEKKGSTENPTVKYESSNKAFKVNVLPRFFLSGMEQWWGNSLLTKIILLLDFKIIYSSLFSPFIRSYLEITDE